MPTRRAVKVLRSFISQFCNHSHITKLAAIVRHARNAHYFTGVVSIRRAICFIVCFGLILPSRPIFLGPMGTSAEKPKVQLTQGPPGPNLPNLNEARRMSPGAPEIAPPVSAAFASKIGPSAPPPMQEDNWPMRLIAPENRAGTPGEDLLSRNFNWGAPIVSLPGRAGMDLNLGLSLNSLIWTKSGTNMHFDLRKGFPSPGFRLGLREIGAAFYNSETGTGSMLVTMPSVRVYEIRENPALGPNVYEEMGGTRMLLVVKPGLINYLDTVWTLLLTDGTAYKFKIITNNPKLIEVKDSDGNYISIAYTRSERISAITDTLDRVLNFNYDGSDRLTSITQDWAGGAHTYATFAYDNVTIQTNFPGLDLVGASNGTTISALSRVDMADGKVYAFEYNTYAQVKIIRCYAPNSANPGSFPGDYTLLSSISYDLTPDAGAPQSDCPRFSSRTDWAKDWNDGVTRIFAGDGNSWGAVTTPDGTMYKESFGASGWQRGLTLQTETWYGGSRKKWTTATWVNDNPNVSYWLNPRVVETNVYDENGNQKRTTMAYADFGTISDVREYDAPPNTTTVLRHTHFEYLRGPAYTGNLKRRLTQLVTSQTVYDGSGMLHSKVTYEYDLGGEYLVHQTPLIRHDTTNFGPTFVQGRGNPNRVRRWDVTDPNNVSKSVASTMGYNTSGSVIFSRDPLSHETRLSYADSFSDSVNRNTLAYPTTMTDADNYSSTVQYNYYFGAETRTQDPKGAAVVTTYDSTGRIERVTNQVNAAYTRYVYAPNHLYVQSFTTVNDLSSEFYKITVLDGHGRARGVASGHPGSAGGYKAQNYEYDIMGRLSRQSNPTEINVNWEPAGDDAGWAWSSQAYDWQGRSTVSTNQDGTTSSVSYEGCGCAGGQKVVLIDEVGRRREQSFDILGRMWRERTYNWGGSNETGIYTTSTNTYNIRDQVTNINVLDNASGVSQNTVMTYDGHGRVKTKQSPIYLGNPQSETPYDSYEYNSDDTLMRKTDPRGATATYGYNNRRLVTSVIYGAPSGVAPTPNVTFEYDEAGNRTVMDDGPGRVTYSYDTLGRMTSETRVFDRLSRYISQVSGQPYQNTFTIGYNYNLTGQLTQIQTPTGDTIDYTLDKSGMVTKVSGTPHDGVTDYITDIKYRAWGAAKRVSYGYGDYSIEAQFNGRMLISRIDDQSDFGVTYNYGMDGRLNTVQGIHTRTLDRSISYDHLGRVTHTLSGSAAGLGSPDPEQLKQYYARDAFGHMTFRFGRYWYTNDYRYPAIPIPDPVFTATYINDRGMNVVDSGRNQEWQYDMAGNIKRYFNASSGFYEILDSDAVGRMARKSFDNGSEITGWEDSEYDGDGNLVSNPKQNSFGGGGTDKYFVMSTALSKSLLNGSISWSLSGGQYLITKDLGGDVTERNLSISVAGEEVATRTYDAISEGEANKVTWQHRDPHNTIAKIGNASSSTLYSVDPLGVLVKTATASDMDAYWSPPGGGEPPTPPEGFYSDQSGQKSAYGYSSPAPGNWGLGCYVDSVQVQCERAFRFVINGSGNIDPETSSTGGRQIPGITIVPDHSDSSKDYAIPREDGGDIYGTSPLKIHFSNLFAGQIQLPSTPTPWTVKNNVTVVRDMVWGLKTADNIIIAI